MRKLPLLHLEELPGNMMNVKANNLPDVIKMIWNVMDNRQDIASAFITAVAGYCRENNISWGDMMKIAEKYNIRKIK